LFFLFLELDAAIEKVLTLAREPEKRQVYLLHSQLPMREV
jgi:hypothetical protein